MRSADQTQVLAEYRRRDAAISPTRYAPWNPAAIYMHDVRRRVAAQMLHAAGAFPRPTDNCLEVGFGRLGWLADLIGWGVQEDNLSGIELDSARAEIARRVLPAADLRVGDATEMPWPDGTFDLVVISTVFTSILDDEVRRMLAREVVRVLSQAGAVLWYDFTVNNPGNPHVRKVTRSELRRLFPSLVARLRSVTLAPPIVRAVAPRCWWLASLLEAFPFLRTHLIGVLQRPVGSSVGESRDPA